MPIGPDIAAYKTLVNLLITTATNPLSISPDMVGSGFTDLADLLETYYGQQFDILGGTGVPNDADGQDGDMYIRDNNPTTFYKKELGTWVEKASVTWGIIFPDGALVGLLTSISGDVVTVTPGGWVIDNVIYRKATQTQFTLTAADLNFGRYDLIYADELNQILKLDGTTASTPVIPTVPANCVMIDVAFTPSSSSGLSPYLLYGNNLTTANGKTTINKTQANLIDGGGGNWYLKYLDNNGDLLPADIMPYSVKSKQGAHTYPIPALLEDDYSWDAPRIYGFPDPATTQVITIFAI